MNVMNYDHPKWQEFLNRLEGPEGCNFRKDNEGEITWNCNAQPNRPLAITILNSLVDIDIPASMSFFDEHGGYCDCEILFNVAHGEKYNEQHTTRERLKKATLEINEDIADIARKYDLNSNMGYEALYSGLIEDLGQALARWRLRAFETSEKRKHG